MQIQYPLFKHVGEMQDAQVGEMQVRKEGTLSKKRYVLVPILAGLIVLALLAWGFSAISGNGTNSTGDEQYTSEVAED